MKKLLVYIIDSDEKFRKCLALEISSALASSEQFSNVFDAIEAVNRQVPDLFILDILLDGPDGLEILNELASYPDTSDIPVIIVSNLDLSMKDFSSYPVVAIFNKKTYRPIDLISKVKNVKL